MDNNELQHHGIPGMKWGIRRYQNKDGTLTNAGKKRYEKELAKAKEEAKLIKNRERTQAKLDKLSALKNDNASRKAALDHRKAEEKPVKEPKHKDKPVTKKSIKDLTDDELAAVVKRLQLEKQLESMTPKKVSMGRQFVDSALKPAINDAGKRLLTDFAIKQGKKFMGLDEKSNALEDIVKDLRLKKEHKELSDYLAPKSESKRASEDLKSIVDDLRNEKAKRQLLDWLDEDDKKRKK
jgi:hypothetical protein